MGIWYLSSDVYSLIWDSEILVLMYILWYGNRHLATNSGILLLIQAFCYRFRHLDTDSGILLQVQAFCYRFMQFATGSCNLIQGSCNLIQGSCNLLQGHAIWYKDHAIWYRVLKSDNIYMPCILNGIMLNLLPKGWKFERKCTSGFVLRMNCFLMNGKSGGKDIV